ncbi:MAG: 30S ribosomal protein S2 [Chloroflexota bacterium]|nr:30S ribosomal protein S2 [Chloroflexota bacterium]
MATISMKQLLETGAHFGHRTGRWHPNMKPFIFTARKGIHIIDLQQTMARLEEACEVVRDVVSEGGTLLFLGTKRQAKDIIQAQAERCSMPYVNKRWLGGTLTNWQTIHQRVNHLHELEERRDRGELDVLPKKEAAELRRMIEKLNYSLGGIKDMKRLPDLLFVIDVSQEDIAVREANIKDIPIVAVVDTNCDPRLIDYVIPANDDAIRTINLITNSIADAVIEGQQIRASLEAEEEEEWELEEEEARYLGEATLAKLRSGELEFDEVEEDLDLVMEE